VTEALLEAPPENHVFGAVAELFAPFDEASWEENGYLVDLKRECRPPKEYLVEGPAGTGKSHGVLEYVLQCCLAWPGIRVLFLRQTRATLAESILVEWEQAILGEAHPAITGTATRENRKSYTFPEAWNPYTRTFGRTHVVIGGLDKPSKSFSTQYDMIVLFEGIEVALDTWVLMPRANRNWHMPFQQRIVETNPGPVRHWLNLRPDEDDTLMHRLCSRHKDNPVYWDHVEECWTAIGEEYVEGDLKRLPGAVYDRMYLGKWVSEEGLVWPTFDRAIHEIDQDDVPDDARWCVGSMDFGYRNPGSLNVWAIDKRKRAFRVAEVYKTGWIIDKWAEVIDEIDDMFGFTAIICDNARPDDISALNTRLGAKRGRGMAHIAQPCKKRGGDDKGQRQLFGLDHVRDALDPTQEGGPRMFFVRNSLLKGRDEGLARRRAPTDTVQEIEAYSFQKHADGKPDREHPDPMCADHGCDNVRYFATWLWPREGPAEPPLPNFPVGTYGHEWADELRGIV
jgi:phage terminase large subunit